MSIRLLPDGSLLFDSVEDALAAQEKKQQRIGAAPLQLTIEHAPMKPTPAAARALPVAAPARPRTQAAAAACPPVRQTAIRWSVLGYLEENLSDTQKGIIHTISERDETSTRDIATLHPEVSKDVGKAMKTIREKIEAAGLEVSDVLVWEVTGWGSDKRSIYKPGPKLKEAYEQ